jgi:hypothetical protein
LNRFSYLKFVSIVRLHIFQHRYSKHHPFTAFLTFGEVSNNLTALNCTHHGQGCQMVYLQTKNPNLGKFWRALDWKFLIHFWAILRTFGIFYDHLVHVILFSGFGNIHQEKSGNPDHCGHNPYLQQIN